ncbi:HDOD domain-containing protein [Bacillus sp. FJAT-42376]|uniref:EAL and HDOD domain-containing protein n=1 Tax=Bacillus sp. FJAT-42376 TaxID=2014076 RepID=UPI000F4DFA8C|nr:HDOD domain-containing protein [Bacillus sp. FJAT-42376]AZB44239.1 HDOD domain-containing protein [Bacillus sp. FJAT-42376]
MKVFIGRQPIFDRKGNLEGYELLYRNSKNNYFPDIDGNEATLNLILDSFLNMGINELSEGKPCFINFTEDLLRLGIPDYLDPKSVVIEILENIPVSAELAEICKSLKGKGYTVALDDFFIHQELINREAQEILYLADYIKVDLQKTSLSELREMMNYLKKYNLKYIAEKVETQEQFMETKELGCELFQGYFFSKPVILLSHDMPLNLLSYFKIIKELNEEEPRIDYVAHHIEQDLSLSYKLLKLMNSPAFRPSLSIQSIQQAIVLLGLTEIRKWIYIMSVRSFYRKNDPMMNEVIKLSLIRAKICEQIAVQTDRSHSSSYMLTGMFSMIDTLLHREMKDILDDLPLTQPIKDALSGTENDLLAVFKWSRKIELGEYDLPESGLSEEEAYDCYINSIHWAENLMEGTE